jgi:hypothetical protein
MRKIIGNEIHIYLKESVDNVPDIIGLLVDVTEDELYLRDIIEIAKLYVVPRINIKYCITDCIPQEERTIRPELSSATQTTKIPQNISYLEVFVDEKVVASIPVPPTFILDEWHEGIMKVILGSQDVKAALIGRIQKSIEYLPGKVYITSEDDENFEKYGQKPFVMGGDVSSKFLSPTQMAAKLNNAVQRRRENVEPNKEQT